MPIERRRRDEFEFSAPLVVVGAGGCGLTAALAARDSGVEVLVVERDPKARGTTAMSTGLIPAAGTPEQLPAGIIDSPKIFAGDIQAKAHNEAAQDVVERLARESAETVAWLRDRHDVPLTLVDGFRYPGHSVRRMYGTPNRSGAELMVALKNAAVAAGADILTNAIVRDLYIDAHDVISGVGIERPDGSRETIGCTALILACCGFAGNSEMVAKYIPELEGAVFHGHPGNKGDAIKWGEELGAALGDLGAYQGHGGLATGHAIPILWPLIMEGGFQVNRDGRRFSDESQGYSEQAVKILAQPDRHAWSIFDQRLYELMLQFDDFHQAIAAGAIERGDTIPELAAHAHLPAPALAETMAEVESARSQNASDRFGRKFFADKSALRPPYYAIKVWAALFHTQGGLEINPDARVLRKDGSTFPNLFAGGGAARGISGSGASGYIAGNGLLTATTLGKIAGRIAACQING